MTKNTLLGVIVAVAMPAICYGDEPFDRPDDFNPNPDAVVDDGSPRMMGEQEVDFTGLKLYERNDLDARGNVLDGAKVKTVGVADDDVGGEENPAAAVDDDEVKGGDAPAEGETDDGAGDDSAVDDGEAGDDGKKPFDDSKGKEEAKKGDGPETKGEGNDDLDEIQPSKNARPEIKNGFKALKEKVKSERAEKAVLQSRISELEEQINKAPQIDTKHQEYVKQLEAEVARHNVEYDPVYKDKYKAPYAQKTEDLLAYIDTVLPGALKDGHKDKIREANVHKIDPAWWDALIDKVPSVQKASLQRRLAEAIDLGLEMDGYKAKVAKDPVKYQEELQAREQERWAKWGEEARNYAEKELKPALGEWINEKAIPDGATKEQRAAIEAHNAEIQKHVKVIEEIATNVMRGDPKDVTRASVAVVHAEHLKGQLAEVTKERESLKQEIETLRKRLGSIKAAGKVATTTASAPKGQSQNPVHNTIQSADDALRKFGISV